MNLKKLSGMLKEQDIPFGKIYILGALVFLLTAWFSVGYNHFDEHFQVIEFAGLKLGLTEKANLPWEYKCMMRPALQPLVVYSLYKTISLTGVTDPFIIAFFIRLLSAVLAFVSIHMVIRMYAPGIANRKLLYGFLLLSFFLWFVPYNSVRFSSETAAGRVFLIGLAWFFLRNKLMRVDYLITGVLLGISFITRYQVAFMIIGFTAWLAFIRKAGIRNLIFFSSGIVLAVALGVLIDRWFYGEWVLTSWNYFQQNILLDKAAGFGISPWWYYIEQTFMNAFPPFSLVYILGVFLYFIYYPRDVLTWTIMPFLAIHFLIPHKEIRFLFPIIGFLPVMIIRTSDALLKIKGYDFLEHRATKIFVKLFWYLNLLMVGVLAFRPADDQIALYKNLWKNYPVPAKLYFTEDNPYHRAKVDANFYKKSSLTLLQVDSLQWIIPSKDTVSLVVTGKPGLQVNEQFTPVLVYSSFPQWVSHFNFNHWMERTSFWYVYELKTTSKR
jgi:GPI mannosyltransferase 3